MTKVFHFVPTLNIGGAEIAIEKSLPDLQQKLDISIFYVKCYGVLHVGQRPWWQSLKYLFAARPDVVITSFWWAHPVGFLFKLFGIRWVCFIHNSRFANFLDRLTCTISILLSDETAADSDQSAAFIRSIKKIAKISVIPYIFPLPQDLTKIERIKNTFIFVGRNAKEKRMDLVVGFFKHLLTNFPAVACRFAIAGHISADVLNLMQTFGKRVAVEVNPANSEVIQRLRMSEYFVVLSDFEGFCMTAHEAVQAGCFVIYRDVGAIKEYVISGQSFQVTDPEDFYSQFDEVFKRRNELDSAVFQGSALKPRDSYAATYSSRFIDLVDNKIKKEKDGLC